MVRELVAVDGLLIFILVPDVAIGDAVGPFEVIDIVYFLNVHRDTFETVGDLYGDRMLIDTADLLEIGELGDFHAVEPDFPADAPCA